MAQQSDIPAWSHRSMGLRLGAAALAQEVPIKA